MSDADNRQSPRIARSFMVRYRVPTPGRTGWLVSPLRDLSSSGVRFVCEKAFDVGLILEMELLLPTAKQPVPLRAKVVWTKPVQWGMVELGATFEPVDATVQQMINDAVAYSLRTQQEKNG